jgi:hypothetical protein
VLGSSIDYRKLSTVKDPPGKQKVPPKETTSSELKDSRLSENNSMDFGPKVTIASSTEAHDLKENLPPGVET